MIDHTSLLNNKIVGLKPSGIRRFFDIANEMDDVISLSIGEPDFTTPWHVREEGIRSLRDGKTWYTPNSGFKTLRGEICNYMSRRFGVSYNSDNEVLVTVGGSEAIDLCMRCLINPGDEVLIVSPSFVCYEPICLMCGGIPVTLKTKAENNFKLTPQALRDAITEKTKMLVLPYPNNPTGAIMTKRELEEICDIIKEHNILVMSDEIYGELTYTKEGHTCLSSIDGMKERSIIVSGFSKSYAMTGWRLGYALGPKKIIEAMTRLHQYAIMSAPTTAQYAAIEALKNGDEDILRMRKEYNQRRRYIIDSFNKMGLDCFEGLGAFYVFPCIKSTGLSSEDFCMRLLQSKRVAVVPGNAFGDCGEGFIRVSYSYSLDHIKEAVKRINEFLTEIKK
ncbi:MAG: aminotransferase class I/II-fold pyridoxal phosphate-dependent enzyme [Clostridiales bacterium]|nr:aminotransferase class I/II-fold pyridoxal phosphate-dependent enzyme [Clostridiales bacterium]